MYRHVNGLNNFHPVLIAQKSKGDWPGVCPQLVPRSAFREARRRISRLTTRPWQVSEREARRILNLASGCRLLHIFFGNTAVHLLPVLRRARLPVLVSFHGSDVAGEMAAPGSHAALVEMFARSALVACRSQHLLGRVRALGCPPEKLRVMRAILPSPSSSCTTKSPPQDGIWRVLQAGRMVPKKGMATALRAFAQFHKNHPGAMLTLAGDGSMREELEALVRELGIVSAVRMPGFLSQSALAGEFSRTHFLLHPSETVADDTEGVPNILLEAMAQGLVPVATSHGGIPEAVESGVSGILCPEAQPAALANAMCQLADSPDLYQRMSQAAASRIAHEFSATAQIPALEALYQEVMAARPAAAD